MPLSTMLFKRILLSTVWFAVDMTNINKLLCDCLLLWDFLLETRAQKHVRFCLFLHLTRLWILVTILFAISLFMSCFGCCSIFIFHLCWFVGGGCCEKQRFADSLQNIILWRMLLCFAVSFFTFFELFYAYENS